MKHIVMLATLVVIACHAKSPADYGDELVKCNKEAATCEASIACENLVRAKYGRALRDSALGCK